MAFGRVAAAAVRRASPKPDVFGARPRSHPARVPRRDLPRPQPGACPELDCVRDLLPEHVVAAAERRARSVGVGAERVLICAGALTEEAYVEALAASLGIAFEPLEDVSRAECPLDDRQLIQAAVTGLLPLRRGHETIWVVAPRGPTARQLADLRRPLPKWLGSFCLTSSERLRHFVARRARRAIGQRATDQLRLCRPLFSNAPRARHNRSIRTAVLLVAATAAFIGLAPAVATETVSIMLSVLFLCASALRLASIFVACEKSSPIMRIADSELPVYTVICALYRESAVVADLVTAIRKLDYPPEKLDVKFVLEADDQETRRALERLRLGLPFEIIIAPAIGPRTKPKALNVALPFAHGAFVVVYDAEDVPEPDQLRRAIDAFSRADRRLACVQAALTIDNTADNWLARMFTANYAGQFDVFLPALAALALPFPLGGSSNHFRTRVLRQLGAWDPYNVTEDADLGIRLCRLGYRSAMLSSATYEEAPTRLSSWLSQRTRWYKGWTQTFMVHIRRPGRLLREHRALGVIAFQLLLSASLLAALLHPLFAAGLCYLLFVDLSAGAIATNDSSVALFSASMLFGYASMIAVDLIGLRRRGLFAHAWVLVLTPLHWLLLSLAAWRALFQLLRDPQRWEKTEHGLARTSRISTGHEREGPGQRPAMFHAQPVAPIRIMQLSRRPMFESAGRHK